MSTGVEVAANAVVLVLGAIVENLGAQRASHRPA